VFVKPEHLLVIQFVMEKRERQFGKGEWCRVSVPIIPSADRGAARYKGDFHIYES
jgi:hypothetical protein